MTKNKTREIYTAKDFQREYFPISGSHNFCVSYHIHVHCTTEMFYPCEISNFILLLHKLCIISLLFVDRFKQSAIIMLWLPWNKAWLVVPVVRGPYSYQKPFPPIPRFPLPPRPLVPFVTWPSNKPHLSGRNSMCVMGLVWACMWQIIGLGELWGSWDPGGREKQARGGHCNTCKHTHTTHTHTHTHTHTQLTTANMGKVDKHKPRA